MLFCWSLVWLTAWALILYIDLLALPSPTSRVGLLEISNTTRCNVCSTGWNLDWDCFLFDLHFAAIFLRNKKTFRLPCPQLRNSARTCKFPFITLPHFYGLFYFLQTFTAVELWTIFCDSCIVTDQLFFLFFLYCGSCIIVCCLLILSVENQRLEWLPLVQPGFEWSLSYFLSCLIIHGICSCISGFCVVC